MAFPLALIAPALVTPVAEGLGLLFKKVFGGKGDPQTVDDRVKLDESAAKLLRARGDFLAAESFSDLSAWAGNLKLENRPWLTAIAVLLVLVPRAVREITRPALAWIAVLGAFAFVADQNPLAPVALDMAGSVYSLYFGDRAWGYIKGRITGGQSN